MKRGLSKQIWGTWHLNESGRGGHGISEGNQNTWNAQADQYEWVIKLMGSGGVSEDKVEHNSNGIEKTERVPRKNKGNVRNLASLTRLYGEGE